jgi:hypothetical protein
MTVPPGIAEVHEEASRIMRIVLIESALVLLIAVATGWLTWRQQNLADSTGHLAAVTRCQVRYNTAYSHVQKIRTTLANDINNATSKLITTVFTIVPGQTQAQRDAADLSAYHDYQHVLKVVTQQRSAHPVPDPPNCSGA